MGEIHIYHLEVSMMISFEVKQGPKKVIDRYQECSFTNTDRHRHTKNIQMVFLFIGVPNFDENQQIFKLTIAQY